MNTSLMNNSENNSTFFLFYLICFLIAILKIPMFVTESINFFLFVATSQNTNEVLAHDTINSGNNTPFPNDYYQKLY